MSILVIIFLVVGYIVGLHLALITQAVLIVTGMVFLNSRMVRMMEIGALQYITCGAFFTIGIAIGDLVYLIANPETSTMISDGLRRIFIP